MDTITENHIVGFGLAGAVLSWRLYWEGVPFSVTDSGVNYATKTAAGLINPVVFRKLTKSWMADELLPEADQFYSRVGAELGLELLSRKSIHRIFASIEEANNWAGKMGDESFEKYLDLKDDQEGISHVRAPHGIGVVKTLGNLDTVLFLERSKAFFKANGITFTEGLFDYDQLQPTLRYFFCEGFGLKINPYFQYLPLNGTHGEVMIIRSDDLNFDEILNKNMFILALGDGYYKIGATYNWELKEPIPTEKGKAEILEKMMQFTSFEYEVVEHWAGIRPTVIDRRPLIGQHPDQSNLFVFNGLGTKGVMIAPLFSAEIFQFVFQNKPLSPEVDIRRYEHLRTDK